MEQKKTLWIVAAAGIFLLVVVGAALILYSPSVQQSSGFQAGFDPSTGWISSTKNGVTPVPSSSLSFNSETPAAQEQTASLTPTPFMNTEKSAEPEKIAQNQEANSAIHADKLTVISDNTTLYSNGTTTIDLNSLKSSSSAQSAVVARNELTENQIRANSEAETQSPKASASENYYAPAPKKAESVAAAPKTTAKASSSSQAKKSSATASAPTKAKTQAKVASTAKKAADSFWVQAAAYTSKRNADEARTTLESNKIPSEVFTFTDSNGKTFYRVRVGPYITKSEAEYWQTRIGMIDKFASSKSVIVNTAVN